MRKSSEIKALRKRMGLTCAGFAVVVGCTEPTVRNWERGLSVQPRYRIRLDAVAQTVSSDPRSRAADGRPVAVLVVEDGNTIALFAKGRKPLVGKSVFGLTHTTAVASWLGAGVKFTLTVAEVTSGMLEPAY